MEENKTDNYLSISLFPDLLVMNWTEWTADLILATSVHRTLSASRGPEQKNKILRIYFGAH